MGTAISSVLFQPPQCSYYKNNSYFFLHDEERKKKIACFFINNEMPLTILFSHGNAEDIGHGMKRWFEHLAVQLGVNFMAYDYCGYGLSSAQKPSEADCYKDGELAFNFLTQKLRIPNDRIILYSRSLGSGATCHLGLMATLTGNPVRGMILQSPLVSVYRVAFPFRFTMCGDMFPNIDKIQRIQCPITVIHGTNDEIVPFWHGQELYIHTNPLHRRAPLWIGDGGHNNLEALTISTKELQDHLAQFIDSLDRPVDEKHHSVSQTMEYKLQQAKRDIEEKHGDKKKEKEDILPDSVLRRSTRNLSSQLKAQSLMGGNSTKDLQSSFLGDQDITIDLDLNITLN